MNGRAVSPQYDVVQDDKRTTQTAGSMPLMQNEPSIAINPKKPTNIIVGYNDFSTLPSTKLPRPFWSYTTDGGTTWIAGASNLPRFPAAPDLCCDTALAFDKNGTAYLATMTFNIDGGLIILYVSPPDGSGNAGASWNGPYEVWGSDLVDKPAIAIDNTEGAHDGNIYIAWVDYYNGGINDRIDVRTATLVAGVPTFAHPAVEASDPTSLFNWGPAITVAPSGSLYVTYLRMPNLGIASANTIMASRSDDGGASFALRGQVVDSGVVSPPGSFSASRASAFPTITITSNGTVFVAWTDSGAGNMDIQSRASLTNGASWNARARVNDVATNDQLLPTAIYVAGSIYVYYYSRQSDVSNILGGLYVSISTNGGAGFNPSSAFSSTFSNPNVCSSNWTPCLWGDYIGASAVGGPLSNTVCAVWADGRDSQKTGDNDVNVYFKCLYNNTSITVAHTSFWWLISRPPAAAYVPFNICIILPQDCKVRWTAAILPTQSIYGSMSVSLTANNLPSGVNVTFSQQVGYPPFNSTIYVDFSKAQCSDPASCLQSIMITASDGTNSTEIGTNELLSKVPYLVTNTNVYNPGEAVNLTGFGFTANSATTVKLDGKTLGSPSTDNSGSFNLPVNLPTSIYNGTHTLTATDSSSKSASITFFTPKVEVESETGIKPRPPTLPTVTLSPPAIILLVLTIGVIVALPMSRRRKQLP